jgi:hypothetical protein
LLAGDGRMRGGGYVSLAANPVPTASLYVQFLRDVLVAYLDSALVLLGGGKIRAYSFPAS